MDSSSKNVAAGVNSGPATVHGAIGVASQVNERLWGIVSTVEKLAEVLDGPDLEASDEAAATATGPSCMADFLTQTAEGLHTPTTRIQRALKRIERRLG